MKHVGKFNSASGDQQRDIISAYNRLICNHTQIQNIRGVEYTSKAL